MPVIDFEFLFGPLDGFDAWLTGLFDGAPLLVAMGIAVALGLRHAFDPDHLVAVTSLVAADDGGTTRATRLGMWWGLGHAATLIVIGMPLVVLKSELPVWLERWSERTIGAVILLLAARVMWKWARGDYRAGRHAHTAPSDAPPHESHRHLRHADVAATHGHRPVRSGGQAFGIGFLHGLAGTGAVVVLMLAALPTQLEAALALAVFAPISILSMAACTTAFAWILTRPILDPVYRSVLIPLLGVFGVTFGLWYVGQA
jgi:ABC-type nickel/cobalt efflux system permease component RcnA